MTKQIGGQYLWYGPKEIIDGKRVQKSKVISEMTKEELEYAINYCETMLSNKDPEKPGRRVKLEFILNQIKKCNVSIYLKEKMKDESIMTIYEALTNKNPNSKICELMRVKPEFNDITVKLAMQAVMDKLGVFEKSTITLNSLVYDRGVYISPKEFELYNLKPLDKEERVQQVRKILELSDHVPVRLSSFGFTIDDIKKIINLKNIKYSDIDTYTLTLLRDKVLYNSAEKVRRNIKFWTLKKEQLKKTLEEKYK